MKSMVRIVGPWISSHSAALLKDIAVEARIQTLYVTRVQSTVNDQARIFYEKHVVEAKPASYKNPQVAVLLKTAQHLHKSHRSAEEVTEYLVHAIEHVHGGPQAVSRHLGSGLLTEVFDIAHYSGPTVGATRRNFMTATQAVAFLQACRKRLGMPIARLGHSKELGFVDRREFSDEKCFHFEVSQPLYDRLVSPDRGALV